MKIRKVILQAMPPRLLRLSWGVSENMNLMRTCLASLTALCWSCLMVFGQDSIPTVRILHEDVLQGSVQQGASPLATNAYRTGAIMVRWVYTEAGARKMLGFWQQNQGKKTRLLIGTYEVEPTNPARAPDARAAFREGWLKWRSDKILNVTEADAKKIVAGLKGE